MLNDLISTDAYGQYSVMLANTLGLSAAVYINEVVNIQLIAERKNKLKNGMFKLDRKYVQSRTSLSAKEQTDIDFKLMQSGIVTKKSECGDELYVNKDTLLSIMMSDDKEMLKDLNALSGASKAAIKQEKAKSKKQACIDSLRRKIITTDVELITAYSTWIESVIMYGTGKLTAVAVEEAQRLVDEAATVVAQDGSIKRSKDVAKSIIQIAAEKGWADMRYAVNQYNRQNTVNNFNNFNARKGPDSSQAFINHSNVNIY